MKSRPKKFEVSPNPANAGGKVTITGDPGQVVYILKPGTGEDAKEIKLDGKGKAEIDVPVGAGKEFVVSDLQVPAPFEITVDVVSGEPSTERKGHG